MFEYLHFVRASNYGEIKITVLFRVVLHVIRKKYIDGIVSFVVTSFSQVHIVQDRRFCSK